MQADAVNFPPFATTVPFVRPAPPLASRGAMKNARAVNATNPGVEQHAEEGDRFPLPCSVKQSAGHGRLDRAELNRGFHAEVAFTGATFGVEDLEAVITAVFQVAKIVEVHGLLAAGVQAAQVDDQLAIDEDPDVIVAAEGEDLIVLGLIDEVGFELGGEVEVLAPVAVVAEEFAVDGEEAAA